MFSLMPNIISVTSQWGHYNLPRLWVMKYPHCSHYTTVFVYCCLDHIEIVIRRITMKILDNQFINYSNSPNMIYISTCFYIKCMHIYTHVYIYIYIYTYLNTYIYTYVIYVNLYIYIHTYINKYVYDLVLIPHQVAARPLILQVPKHRPVGEEVRT